MEIAVVFLITYAVTSIIGTLYLVGWWFLSILSTILSIHPSDQEPKWVKLLGWYCLPTGYLFMFSLFLIKNTRRLVLAVHSRH